MAPAVYNRLGRKIRRQLNRSVRKPLASKPAALDRYNRVDIRISDGLRWGFGISRYTLARHQLSRPAPARPWIARQVSRLSRVEESAQPMEASANKTVVANRKRLYPTCPAIQI